MVDRPLCDVLRVARPARPFPERPLLRLASLPVDLKSRPATRPSIRGLYRPVARHGDSGRPAPLPTAPDAERHAAAEHQQRGLGPALLLHSDARPAGSGAPAHRRAVSAADTGGAQRRGSDTAAVRANSAEVQGGVCHRLRRRAARLGSRRAQGRRYRFRAHAAARRARQGAQEPALAKAGDRHAMLSPQLLELLRAWWREGRRRSLLLRHERFGGADITTVTGGTTLIPTFGYRSSVISVNMDKFFGLFLACVK